MGIHTVSLKFFILKLPRVHCLDTLWVKNFDEIAPFRIVKEIGANLRFSIFGNNFKIQNERHFWVEESFLKIAKNTLLRYPVGQKFNEIALSGTVKEIEPNLRFFHFE